MPACVYHAGIAICLTLYFKAYSMSKRDYYEILGVQRDASAADMKKAYRRLAMKHHPDRNQGDSSSDEKFKEIQEAYAVLSDDSKRQSYNQFGHDGVNAGAGGGAGGFGGFGDMGDVFGDIFGDFFGGGRSSGGGRGRVQPGADLAYEMVLTLEEAVHGVQREIQVPTWVACSPCNGSGAKKGSSPTTCSTCRGAGQVQIQHGFIAVQQPCRDCRGTGQVIKNPCADCNGKGRVHKRNKLSVKIPAGVDNGDRVRLSGKGEAGMHGAPAGDLYVQVAVKKHPVFQRKGDDLYCDVPVSFVAAALGGEVEVLTMQGSIKLSIPAETQSGKLFRMRSKGVKNVRSSSVGDLLCRVSVETPVNLTDEQKSLLNQFDSLISKDSNKHSPKTKSWFDTVKEFFN